MKRFTLSLSLFLSIHVLKLIFNLTSIETFLFFFQKIEKTIFIKTLYENIQNPCNFLFDNNVTLVS